MRSIRDIYKIGTGPSSSHTMGPARAAVLFRDEHPEADKFQAILYGSLSKTGRGHGTDRALRDAFAPIEAEVIFSEEDPRGLKHPNTLDLIAWREGKELGRIRIESIGGGDIVIEGREEDNQGEETYMENSFAEILQFCQYRYVDLVEYIEMNEGPDIWDYLIGVWHVMKRSVEEGLSRIGELPGGLHIQRKAKYMFEHIVETKHPELVECQKVCSYAYAVSEQNADNGTSVTIAGMGGETILSILKAAPWTADGQHTLLLQPQSHEEMVRQYLAENGFAITREALVRDRGTLYTVMEAKAGKMELSLSQVWGGIGLAHDPLADRYIVEKIVRTQMALAGAKRSTRLQARTEELREILTALLRAREEWRHANRRTN